MWKCESELQAKGNENCVSLMTLEMGLNQYSLSTP